MLGCCRAMLMALGLLTAVGNWKVGGHADDGAGFDAGAPPVEKCAGNKQLGPDSTEAERMAAIAAAVHTILLAIGENPAREGLAKTPMRVAKAMLENTKGYENRPNATSGETLVNKALFHESHSELVIVRDISIFSMCEHHMLPFFGTATIGYVPNGTGR